VVPVTIEVSSDLVAWAPLVTVMRQQAIDLAWVLPDWAALPQVFFRAQSARPGVEGEDIERWADNGHDYQLVRVFQGLDWPRAREAAENMVYRGRRGHLATITSLAEQTWVQTHPVRTAAADSHCWLGGQRSPDSSEPAGGWNWITGEAFDFACWETSPEPDSLAGEETAVRLGPNGGRWHNTTARCLVPCFLVEYEE